MENIIVSHDCLDIWEICAFNLLHNNLKKREIQLKIKNLNCFNNYFWYCINNIYAHDRILSIFKKR